MLHRYLMIGLVFLTIACSPKQENANQVTQQTTDQKQIASAPIISKETLASREKRPNALQKGKFFQKDGTPMLYGGDQDFEHFNISNSVLVDSQFHYGIGREKFQALISPKYMSIDSANAYWSDDAERVLVAKINDDVKIFHIDLIQHHEVINDVIGGKPVMAAYCILADLGALYDRSLGGRTFTFALSGYTYYDDNVWNGMDGFILWDRETESLWWPLIGKAVSGPLLDTKLKVLDEEYWQQTTWGEAKAKYPNAVVLRPNQKVSPTPYDWKKYEDLIEGTAKLTAETDPSVAPKWGDNKELN